MTGPVTAISAAATRATPPAPAAPRTGAGPAFADALRQTGGAAAAITGASPTTSRPGPATPAPGLAGRLVLDAALLGLGRRSTAGGSAGYVADTYRRLGVVLPGEAGEQATMGVAVDGVAAARSGDVVVLGGASPQVGIYAGRGRVVLAPTSGGPVRLQDIDGPVTAIRRIVSDPIPSGPLPSAGAAGGGAATTSAGGGAATTSASTVAPVPPAGVGWADIPHRQLFEQAAASHGVDAAVLAAIAQVESGFDHRAVSPVGAQGLMQFMPGTAAGLGVDPWDPASAIPGAARYLRSALDRFGKLELALAAYNAGPGAVQRHGGIPPFAETQRYVRKVLEAMEQYRR